MIVVLEGEEELGSPNLAAVVSHHREALASDLVLWSDGPVHETGRWCVSHGVRGCLRLRLRATGANQPLHSGNLGNVAPNPAWRLVQALGALRGPDGEITIPDFRDGIASVDSAERAALEALPVDIADVMRQFGLPRLEDPQDIPFYDRLALHPTLTINGIRSGDMGRTIIPESAEAMLDIRLVDAQEPDHIFDAVRAYLATRTPDV